MSPWFAALRRGHRRHCDRNRARRWKRQHGFSPAIEQLEDRTQPSTLSWSLDVEQEDCQVLDTQSTELESQTLELLPVGSGETAGDSSADEPVTVLTSPDAVFSDVSVQGHVSLTPGAANSHAGLLLRHTGPGESNMYLGSLVANAGVFSAQIWRNLDGAWQQLAAVPVAQASATLRFEAVDAQLQLFVDDVLVAFASDSNLTEGAVGLRHTADATVSDLTGGAASTASVSGCFQDPFALAEGATPARTWTQHLGHFDAHDNQVTATGAAINLATLDDSLQADVHLEAEVSVLASDPNSHAGLVARHRGSGDSNMYLGSLVANQGECSAQIWRSLQGEWTQFGSSAGSNHHRKALL